jgi:hypothetical protein
VPVTRAPPVVRGSRRAPLRAEARDQCGVGLVGLGAREVALGVSLDLRRVDDADDLTSLVQVSGERLGVSAGGLHTGVDALHLLSGEPGGELAEARLCVGEDSVLELDGFAHERDVELELGDVDAERQKGHGGRSFQGYTRGGPTL